MSMPDPAEMAAQKMASAIAGLDALSLIAEATAGYRKKLIDGGVGPDAADEMAKEYHTVLIAQLMNGMNRVGNPPIRRRDNR